MSAQFELPSPGELARARLGAGLLKASDVLVALLSSFDEKVRMRAAEAILNRAGISESSAVDWTTAEIEVGCVPRPSDPLVEATLASLFPQSMTP